MTEKMLGHVAKDLIRDQVLTEGFNAFRELGMEFSKEQNELLNGYLDVLLNESILKINTNLEVPAEDENLNNYINLLLTTILNLTAGNFINWGIALFYRYNYET